MLTDTGYRRPAPPPGPPAHIPCPAHTPSTVCVRRPIGVCGRAEPDYRRLAWSNVRARSFGAVADAYDRLPSGLSRRRAVQWVLEPAPGSEVVVDLGAGTGTGKLTEAAVCTQPAVRRHGGGARTPRCWPSCAAGSPDVDARAGHRPRQIPLAGRVAWTSVDRRAGLALVRPAGGAEPEIARVLRPGGVAGGRCGTTEDGSRSVGSPGYPRVPCTPKRSRRTGSPPGYSEQADHPVGDPSFGPARASRRLPHPGPDHDGRRHDPDMVATHSWALDRGSRRA